MGYNEINVGRYLRFLQKFLQMKGREPAEITLAPEIMPGLALFHGAENRYLEGWDRFGVINQNTAGAGTSNQWRLRNPTGSNLIMVIEAIDCASAANQTFIIQPGVGNPNLALVIAANAVDTRGRPNSAGIFSQGTLGVAATFVGIRFISVVLNSGITLLVTHDQEIPILPGSDLTITTSNTVQQDRIGLLWRERALEESERT